MTANISLSPATGTVTTQVTLTGSGFAASTQLLVTITGANGSSIAVWCGESTSGGAIPANTIFIVPTVPLGSQTVTVTDGTNSANATLVVNVLFPVSSYKMDGDPFFAADYNAIIRAISSLGYPIIGGTSVTVKSASYTIYVISGTFYAVNGTTNNIDYQGSDPTPVIQSCINAFGTAGGKIVFRIAVYPLSTTITASCSLTLEGETTDNVSGDGVVFTGSGITMLQYTGHSGSHYAQLTMKNLQFWQSSNTAGNTIELDSGINLNMENVNVEGGLNCLYLKDIYCGIAIMCWLQGAGNAALVMHSTDDETTDITWLCCRFEGSPYGVQMYNANGMTFIGGAIEGDSMGGIQIFGCSHVTLKGLWMEMNCANNTSGADILINENGTTISDYITVDDCPIYSTSATNSLQVYNAQNIKVDEFSTTGNIYIDSTVWNIDLGTYVCNSITNNAPYYVNRNSRIHKLGWQTTTPSVPVSDTWLYNTNQYDVLIYFTANGTVSEYLILDTHGDTQSFATSTLPPYIYLPSGCGIEIVYSSVPSWKWFGL